MTTIYLPVEVSRREAAARAFLATSLAAHGHEVVVFRSDLFDRVGWPGSGLYIGKNYLRGPPPHDPSFYRRMKAAGLRVWHLEEEGGIFAGRGEEDWKRVLDSRFNLTALGPDDKILAWGEWQADAYREQATAAECLITGSPNFDLYQPKYQPAWSGWDARETDGRENYILVNTRFVTANPLETDGAHFVHRNAGAVYQGVAARLDRLVADGVLFYRFVELIAVLARRYPEREIVLRPHPVENADAYGQIFAPLTNVSVIARGDAGPWIRRSALLIHNGCTTAVQAAIAGKPVITYLPAQDDPSAMGLPDMIGVEAHSADDVIGHIDAGAPPDRGRPWQRTLSELDSIDRITELAGDGQSGRASVLGPAKRRARQFDLTELARGAARAVAGKRGSHARVMTKFDAHAFATLPELGNIAAAHYGATVEALRLSRFCYLFRAGG